MKSVELGERMVLQEKLQKEKKICLQQQTLEDNAKLILDAGKNVELLLVSELDTLLAFSVAPSDKKDQGIKERGQVATVEGYPHKGTATSIVLVVD
jgi:hypothetical protein